MRLKAVYRALLKRLAPCRYMEKVGVNFKRGGTYLWTSRLVNRTMDNFLLVIMFI